MPADVPLSRESGLEAWASGLNLATGKGAFDLGLAADDPAGLEARARVAFGLTSSLDASAEAYAQDSGGQVDVGAIAALSGHF